MEHPAITARSDAEIDMYRRQNELTVQGHDIPKPVTSFEESPFPEYVLAEIYKNGACVPAAVGAGAKAVCLDGAKAGRHWMV